MSADHSEVAPVMPRELVLVSGAALIAAAAIFTAFVLPAEFHRDPFGTGKLTGIDRLSVPRTVAATVATGRSDSGVRYYPAGYRSDVIDIPLASPETAGGGVYELEYKVKVRKGGSFVYSWTVDGVTAPDEFYFDFHGESPRDAGPIKVVEYRQANGLSSNGVLIAPMDGVFGWFLQNSALTPAVLHLRISGFYDLVPAGGQGNEAGVEPKP